MEKYKEKNKANKGGGFGMESVTSLDRTGRKSLCNRGWHLNKDSKEREKTRWISGIRVNRQQWSIPGNSEEAIVAKVSKEKFEMIKSEIQSW